jgi:hypothetical protein
VPRPVEIVLLVSFVGDREKLETATLNLTVEGESTGCREVLDLMSKGFEVVAYT